MKTILTTLFSVLMISSVYAENAEEAFQHIDVQFCNEGKFTRSLELDVKPGETQELCYQIRNGADAYAWTSVNFVDARLNAAGDSVVCLAEDSESKSFANYIDFQEESFLVKGKETLEKRVFVEFPENAFGTRFACLTIKQGDKQVQEGAMNVVLRSVYKMTANLHSTVPQVFEGEYQTPEGYEVMKNFDPLYILKHNETGDVFVDMQLTNDGDVEMGINLKLNVDGLAYLYNNRAPISLKPESQIHALLPIADLPFYKGIFGVNVEVQQMVLEGDEVLENLAFDNIQPIHLKGGFVIVPYLFLLVLITVLGAAGYFGRQKYEYEMEKNNSKENYTVKTGDTIYTVAEQFGCTWKDIAKANNVKAPFILEKGAKITVFNIKQN